MPTAIARHVAHADIAVCPLPAIQAAHAHNGGKSAPINGAAPRRPGIPCGGTSTLSDCNVQSHGFSLIGTPFVTFRNRYPLDTRPMSGRVFEMPSLTRSSYCDPLIDLDAAFMV